jgi:hypothetical protein
MDEIWKDIPGFEGVYQISNHGRMKSFKELREGRVLSNVNSKGGYISVVLGRNNKIERSTRIHRLVAEAFIDNPGNLKQVNHKDCNKQNNRADNLEWVTPHQNMSHAARHKPEFLNGMNRYNRIEKTNPIIQLTLDGEYVAMHTNGTEAARATGVCQRNILQVATGTEYKPGKRRSQAGGFNWLLVLTLDLDGGNNNHARKSHREFIERQRICLELSKRKTAHRGGNRIKNHPPAH